MNKKLRKTLSGFSQNKADVQVVYSGELGVPLGGQQVISVPNRAGYVFVRLRGSTSELIQAKNKSVPEIYDLAVLLVRKNNSYEIIGKDTERYSNSGAGSSGGYLSLPKHGGQHSLNPALSMGADVSWIYSRQFMPLLTYPSGTSMSLALEPAFYEWNGVWKYAQNTGTPSFAPLVPTSSNDARMALYYIRGSDNSLQIAGGPLFSGGIVDPAVLAQYIPDIPRSIGLPLAAVRLATGTSYLDWNNIYDMRDFYTNAFSTGTSGGISGIVGQDEGVPLGTGTIINAVGAGVTMTISGSVLSLNIPGGGAANPPVTGSVVIYDDTTIRGSALNLIFENNVTAVVTGSSAYINANNQSMVYDDLSSQYIVSGTYYTHFNLSQAAGGTVLLFFNTTMQSTSTFTMDSGNAGLTTSFSGTMGDKLIAVYGLAGSFYGNVPPAQINPTSVSGCVVWMDASQDSSVDGDAIASWTDRSASANHATQAVAGEKPTFREKVFNTKPALYFDGGDALTFGTNITHAATTVFLVLNRWAKSGYTCMIRLNKYSLYGQMTTALAWGAYNNGERSGGALPDYEPVVLTCKYNGAADIKLFTNGQRASPSGGTDAANAASSIGSDGSAQRHHGFIAELIVFNNIISESDRLAIEAWLAYKWGVYRSNY